MLDVVIKARNQELVRKFQPLIRRLIKQYPKLRGYQFNPLSETETVNVEKLEYHFEDGDAVSPATLVDEDLVSREEGKLPEVKVLGKGELDTELTIKNCDLSEGLKKR